MGDANSGGETLAGAGAAFLDEIQRRLADSGDMSLARRLAPAVDRLTDRLVVLACDRLARGDMTAFYETMLEGMTEAERTAWRRDLRSAWHAAVTRRWQERAELRREVLETILLVKAIALT